MDSYSGEGDDEVGIENILKRWVIKEQLLLVYFYFFVISSQSIQSVQRPRNQNNSVAGEDEVEEEEVRQLMMVIHLNAINANSIKLMAPNVQLNQKKSR